LVTERSRSKNAQIFPFVKDFDTFVKMLKKIKNYDYLCAVFCRIRVFCIKKELFRLKNLFANFYLHVRVFETKSRVYFVFGEKPLGKIFAERYSYTFNNVPPPRTNTKQHRLTLVASFPNAKQPKRYEQDYQ